MVEPKGKKLIGTIILDARYYNSTKTKAVNTIASVARNCNASTLLRYNRAPFTNPRVTVPSVSPIAASTKRAAAHRVPDLITATSKDLKPDLVRWGLSTEGTQQELAVRYLLHDAGARAGRVFSPPQRWQKTATNLLFKARIPELKKLLEKGNLPTKDASRMELVYRILAASKRENCDSKSPPAQKSASSERKDKAATPAPMTSSRPLKRKLDGLDNEGEIASKPQNSGLKRRRLVAASQLTRVGKGILA